MKPRSTSIGRTADYQNTPILSSDQTLIYRWSLKRGSGQMGKFCPIIGIGRHKRGGLPVPQNQYGKEIKMSAPILRSWREIDFDNLPRTAIGGGQSLPDLRYLLWPAHVRQTAKEMEERTLPIYRWLEAERRSALKRGLCWILFLQKPEAVAT